MDAPTINTLHVTSILLELFSGILLAREIFPRQADAVDAWLLGRRNQNYRQSIPSQNIAPSFILALLFCFSILFFGTKIDIFSGINDYVTWLGSSVMLIVGLFIGAGLTSFLIFFMNNTVHRYNPTTFALAYGFIGLLALYFGLSLPVVLFSLIVAIVTCGLLTLVLLLTIPRVIPHIASISNPSARLGIILFIVAKGLDLLLTMFFH